MRSATVSRKTKETSVDITLNLGGGETEVSTGVGFFDHMLTLFFAHANFSGKVTAVGDTFVDAHHTVEDVGILLGQAFKEALGDKRGIARYGSIILPMDETVVMSAVDISGRAYLTYSVGEMYGKVGDFDLELVEEFMRAFAFNSGLTLYIKLLEGRNGHHKAEGIFKSVARSLRAATAIVSDDIPSTKGVL